LTNNQAAKKWCELPLFSKNITSLFSQTFLEIAESVNSPSFNDKEYECVPSLVLQLQLVSEALVVLREFEGLFTVVESWLSLIEILKLPMQTQRVVEFTDAGSGVGITNNDVRYGLALEILIIDICKYIRHHLGLGDSSRNEVERFQSLMVSNFPNIFSAYLKTHLLIVSINS